MNGLFSSFENDQMPLWYFVYSGVSFEGDFTHQLILFVFHLRI